MASEENWYGAPTADGTPIELLADSKLHSHVLNYLKTKLDASEKQMNCFHQRWNDAEKRVQAFVETAPKKKEQPEGKDPAATMPTTIVVPYTYATLMTIVTYYVHTFLGRKPIFQIAGNNAKDAKAAESAEILLQHNADAQSLSKKLITFFKDGQLYGLSVLQYLWESRKEERTVRQNGLPTRQMRTVFEGSTIENVDPFMFFPDPSVPMADVAQKGEYVFWRSLQGLHILKNAEKQGQLMYVDRAGKAPTSRDGNLSIRGQRAGGDSGYARETVQTNNLVQVDQGTCWIIPAEMGLGDGESPELWLFTILNKNVIAQAEPLNADHGQHPVVVSEPQSMGYGFGNLSTADYLQPFQDAMTWFLNSYIYNTRAALNNMFVVNPSMIEMGDLQDGKPGKLIRMKRSAMGSDPRVAVQQLAVTNVTGSHIDSIQSLLQIGDSMSAVNDNLRGINSAGGRKSATEIRVSGEAGASRLAASARLISSQALVPLARGMILNYQQNISTEYMTYVLGEGKSIFFEGEQVVGDFNYPVHDGTLPIDKVALLDIWQQLFVGMLGDQQLRQSYDVGRVFEFIAEMGGAKNIESFRIQVQSPEQIAAGVQSGGLSPI